MAIEGSEPAAGVIVPCLVVPDVNQAVEFYRSAFGAEELYRSPCAGGIGVHSNVRVWNSLICVTQEVPSVRANRVEYSMLASPETLGGSACILQVRVADADEAFDRAVKSGAAPIMPPADMFWGDRYGLVQDPFGHVWAITTVQQVLSPAEIAARLAAPAGGR